MKPTLLDRARAALASRWLPWALAALSSLLAATSLGGGFVADDFLIRGTELGLRGTFVPTRPFDLFHFGIGPGQAANGPELLDSGTLPWWTSPDLRLGFFRPLSSASHWLDFQLFPGSPAMMHAESIALHALLVLVAWATYRRILGAGPIAGLCACLYSVDPGHAIAVGWIASRNSVWAALFGLLALYAHDRWRRGGEPVAGWIAPIALAACLASGESGVGAIGYLAAHALAFEGPGIKRRALAFLPAGVVSLAWAITYKAMGYGTSHSAMYIDPLHDTWAYLQAAVTNIPLDLGARLGGPPVAFSVFLAERVQPILAVSSAVFVVLSAVSLAPLLARDPPARFLAIGATLSVFPIAATIPNDRNLFFVGFGGLALEALIIVRALRERGLFLRLYGGYLALLTCVAAPLSVPASAVSLGMFVPLSRAPLEKLSFDASSQKKTLLFVNPPAPFFISQLGAMRAGAQPTPRIIRSLAPGIYPMTLSRASDTVLDIHIDGGMLPEPGTWPAAPGPSPVFKVEYMAQHLNAFVRGRHDPMHAGDAVSLDGCRVEVLAVTPGGSPTDVRFTFDRTLEDASLIWMVWRDGDYVSFSPPPPGQSVVLPGARMAMLSGRLQARGGSLRRPGNQAPILYASPAHDVRKRRALLAARAGSLRAR